MIGEIEGGEYNIQMPAHIVRKKRRGAKENPDLSIWGVWQKMMMTDENTIDTTYEEINEKQIEGPKESKEA